MAPAVRRREDEARVFLGSDAIVDAWVADLEVTPVGPRPRFDADVMQRTIQAVHEPRWEDWKALQVPTLAIFALRGWLPPRGSRPEPC